MSTPIALGVALAALGSYLLVAAFTYTRRGLLTVRYGLGWLAVSVGLVIAGAVSPLLGRVASIADLGRAELVVAGLGAFLILLGFQLSVSVSRLQDVVRDLAEAHALLAATERERSEAQPDLDSSRGAPGGDPVDPAR